MKIGIASLILALILLLADCLGGNTETNIGIVEDTSYQEPYTTPGYTDAAYTDKQGNYHSAEYHQPVYHPAEYKLYLTFEDDKPTWVDTNSKAYNQAFKGQKVPYKCRRGKWSGYRWLDDYQPQ